MPNNSNYTEELLELTSDGQSIEEFDGRIGHYIRMNLYGNNGNFIKSYYSNFTWKLDYSYNLNPNGQNYRVYYNDEYSPFLDPNYNISVNTEKIQVPIYTNNTENVLDDYTEEQLLYNVLSKDDEMIHTTGTYNYKLDFIYNVLEEFYTPLSVNEGE